MLVVYLGIPGIILAVYLGRYYFALFVTLVCVLALREFYLLTAAKGISPQLWIGPISCVVISLFYYFGPALPVPFINPRDFVPLMMLIIILTELTRGKANAIANVMTTMGGIIYVPLFLGALIGIQQIGIGEAACPFETAAVHAPELALPGFRLDVYHFHRPRCPCHHFHIAILIYIADEQTSRDGSVKRHREILYHFAVEMIRPDGTVRECQHDLRNVIIIQIKKDRLRDQFFLCQQRPAGEVITFIVKTVN